MSYHIPFEVSDYTYEQAMSALQATKKFGIQPLLESVSEMLLELKNPDECFRSVQIAGTNGKTSTSRYTAAFLREEGLKTALYTSPELVKYTERMEIDGAPVTEEVFGHGIAAAVAAGKRVNAARIAAGRRAYDITEFDLLTVAALTVFAEAGVDVAVLECGMGGRWDATSAAKNITSVAITGIGLDHTRILGNTLEEIAGEKAAIIQRGRSCVLGVGTATPASVEEVFLSRAAEQGVAPTLLRATDVCDVAGEMQEGMVRHHADLPCATFAITKHPTHLGFPLELTVKTRYQAANIALALCLAEDFLDRVLDADKAFDAAISCPTPGRFQLLRPDPLVLIDAAHNPQSVATFLTAIRDVEPNPLHRPKLLTAVLADKDVFGIAELLAKEFPAVIVTQTDSARALPADELAKIYRDLGARVEGVFPTVEKAVRALARESYVACGTITLAGEVMSSLRGL